MRETGVYTRLFVGLVSPLAFLRLNPPLMALLGLVFCFFVLFCVWFRSRSFGLHIADISGYRRYSSVFDNGNVAGSSLAPC